MKNPSQCSKQLGKEPLPRLMVISQQRSMQPGFEVALEAALRGGARWFQLREKDLPAHEVLALARRAKTLCDGFGAQLIVNSYSEVAREVGAWRHCSESEIESLKQARGTTRVLGGASVHSLEAALRAQELGADYLIFGSVFQTASHPQSTPAGLGMLRAICEKISIPVFAIGGITPLNARACLGAGAHGVAVIGAAWSTPDVTQAVRELIETMD